MLFLLYVDQYTTSFGNYFNLSKIKAPKSAHPNQYRQRKREGEKRGRRTIYQMAYLRSTFDYVCFKAFTLDSNHDDQNHYYEAIYIPDDKTCLR